jgi:predicted transglutaminase-like cysteine proteinase
MWKGHCTSKTRFSRWLAGLAGGALLSSPVFAEELQSPQQAVELADSITQSELCAPVSLAESGMIAPAAGPTASKSAAILGGEPSSLDRIRMAQTGAEIPVATQPVETRSVAVDLSNTEAVSAAIAPMPACSRTAASIADAPAIADDRMILGSLRLSIRKTPFDQKWGKVSRPGAANGLKRSLVRTGATVEADPRKQVAVINAWVNGQITYADDIKLYRQNDYWASSRETLRRRKGDCEDYAILKMDLLAAMGIDRDRMILVVARDLVRNADHAVLVVQLDDGPVVLDNSTDKLLDGRLPNDYRPIMSFASNGKWLHGYAVAAAAPQPAPVPAIAAISVPSMPATLLSIPVSAGN